MSNERIITPCDTCPWVIIFYRSVIISATNGSGEGTVGNFIFVFFIYLQVLWNFHYHEILSTENCFCYSQEFCISYSCHRLPKFWIRTTDQDFFIDMFCQCNVMINHNHFRANSRWCNITIVMNYVSKIPMFNSTINASKDLLVVRISRQLSIHVPCIQSIRNLLQQVPWKQYILVRPPLIAGRKTRANVILSGL